MWLKAQDLQPIKLSQRGWKSHQNRVYSADSSKHQALTNVPGHQSWSILSSTSLSAGSIHFLIHIVSLY